MQVLLKLVIKPAAARHTGRFCGICCANPPGRTPSGFSIEMPYQTVLFQSPTNRMVGLRIPIETRNVLRVDRQRRVLGAGHHANFFLGHKTPRLTKGRVEMIIIVVVLRRRLGEYVVCSYCSRDYWR